MEWVSNDEVMKELCGPYLNKILSWNSDSADMEVVHRLVLDDKTCAWLKLFGTKWGVLAIAPFGDVFDADTVPAEDFFSKPFPTHWSNPSRIKGMQRARKVDPLFPGDWIAGVMPGTKQAQLARCVESKNGVPTKVQLSANGDYLPAQMTGYPRYWFKVHDKNEACKYLWDRERQLVHNYPLFLMQIANCQRRIEDGLTPSTAPYPKSDRPGHAERAVQAKKDDGATAPAKSAQNASEALPRLITDRTTGKVHDLNERLAVFRSRDNDLDRTFLAAFEVAELMGESDQECWQAGLDAGMKSVRK